MTEQAISFKNIGFAYDSEQWVLRHYSGAINRGKVLAILGPNGCGKTTLLKLLLGDLQPREGSLQVNGNIAFVPQLFQVSFPYTVLEMVLMGRVRHVGLFSVPSSQDKKAALSALDRLNIAHLAQCSFDKLSGGQRQLVIFARAIATAADILILDEPTSALDLQRQGVILSWMKKLSQQEGITVIFTTHYPNHAYGIADSVLLMLGQRNFYCGSTQDVMTEEHLYQLYGVHLKHLRFEHQGKEVQAFLPILQMSGTEQ